MKKICLIGNNKFGKPAFDGQRLKVRAYLNVLKEVGEVFFVELDNPLLRYLKIKSQIKKGIKECDIIVLITSDNGERILIPFINKINSKYHKRFVFSQIGTSFLYSHIKYLTESEKESFFHEHNFHGQIPEIKVSSELKKIDAILAETELIRDAFISFYGLDNCYYLTNFRDYKQGDGQVKDDKAIRLAFLSRVTKRKGIFELLESTSLLLKEGLNLCLDIYGELSFNKNEETRFHDFLNNRIRYLGGLSPNKVIDTLSGYNFLCFPTKCEGEGTPGCVIESLIAGTPVISSNFTQSDELLTNGVDSLLYEFNNKEELYKVLKKVALKEVDYKALSDGAKKSGEKFTFEYNKEKFYKLILGEER